MGCIPKLTGKQRQFLILVDKQDRTSQCICEKLMQEIDIQYLLDLNLVYQPCEKKQNFYSSSIAAKQILKKAANTGSTNHMLTLDDLPNL